MVLVAVGLAIALSANGVVVQAHKGDPFVVTIYLVGCVVVGVGIVYPFAKRDLLFSFVVGTLVGFVGGLVAIILQRL